ncbi:MAG: hypothetical protein HN561_01650 [Candidatus Scalindua sp.]|nr:hypothetical protein [Candidatus Scalindua sp.]
MTYFDNVSSHSTPNNINTIEGCFISLYVLEIHTSVNPTKYIYQNEAIAGNKKESKASKVHAREGFPNSSLVDLCYRPQLFTNETGRLTSF